MCIECATVLRANIMRVTHQCKADDKMKIKVIDSDK